MTTSENIDIIWDYMKLNQPLGDHVDAIFVLGNSDVRTAQTGADLFLNGYADWLVISGGYGTITKEHFSQPEAKIFADIAMKAGVPKDRIIIEDKATNTGENIQFTYNLLKSKGFNFDSFILVQKPYMERRTFATFMKQWPEPGITAYVTSFVEMKRVSGTDNVIAITSRITLDEYCSENIKKDGVINIMIGDLQRIKEYPKLGYQISQDIPEKVWQAWKQLVEAGYDKHLIED